MRISRVGFPYIIVLVTSLLSACGGGGGATNTDLKVDTTSVSFNATVNGVTPVQEYMVSWTRTDVAAVLFGYPPGTTIPTWLNITTTNTSSPILLNLSVNTYSLAVGTYTTTVRIVSQNLSGGVVDIVDIPVTLNVGDTVSASPSTLSFSTNLGEAPTISSKTVNLIQSGKVLTPTSVSVSAGTSWLQATINNNDIVISTTSDVLTFSSGGSVANVSITHPFGTTIVPVNLYINQRPFSFVTPYIGTTNVASNVIIRGSGFLAINSPTIKFGSIDATSSSVVSDSEIHATYPAIATKGTYPITISGTGSDTLLNAELVIQDPPTYPDSTITRLNNGTISGMVYDAERSNLYIADNTNGFIERYHYDGIQWNADELAVSAVKGIALSPDGIELLAMSDDYVVHVNGDSFAITALIPAPYISNFSTAASTNLNHIAIANDGIASIMTEASVLSGNDIAYSYNILSRTFTGIPNTLLSYSQDVAVTADGSRVIAVGTAGSLLAQTVYYDASSQSYVGTSLYQNSTEIIMNADGTRWLSGSAVYDETFSLVGNMTDTLNAAFNLVGHALYVYSDIDGLLHKYDVTTANGSGNFDEVGTATSITAAPLGDSNVTPTMTATPDGSKLFIASSNKIQIMTSP